MNQQASILGQKTGMDACLQGRMVSGTGSDQKII